jgi:hypothetical protein
MSNLHTQILNSISSRTIETQTNVTAEFKSLPKPKPRNFSCDKCKYTCSKEIELQYHLKAKHLKEKHHTCEREHCSFKTTYPSSLQSHIKSVHEGDKPFRCDICQESFSDKGKLNRHVKLAHEKQIYSCSFCEKSYSRKDRLTDHMKKNH